jgi:DNA-binding HxlR family transcriptional regulator
MSRCELPLRKRQKTIIFALQGGPLTRQDILDDFPDCDEMSIGNSIRTLVRRGLIKETGLVANKKLYELTDAGRDLRIEDNPEPHICLACGASRSR